MIALVGARARRLAAALLLIGATATSATERELDTEPPPRSASDIETPTERMFPRILRKKPVFPHARDRL